MGRDKALLVLEGELLFARVAASISSVADPIALARGSRTLPDSPWEQLDDAEGEGPLAGLVAALRWSPHELTAVVAVDMPFASPSLLEELVEAWSGQDAMVPMTAHGTQPLHAIYARSALGKLENRLDLGDYGLRAAVDALEVAFVDRRSDERFQTNLNTPEDLIGLDVG
jgi:molybdopterin-guanine dinucleotide biosynthesis protein A